MTDVAKVFGRTFGPKNKMPNPKSGAVVTPASNLPEIKLKLEKTVRLKTRNEAILKTFVGNETMKDEDLADNIVLIYESIIKALPQGEGNIRDVLLKLTMGPALKVEK